MTEILKLIERDGRLSAAQIAAMLGREQKEVEDVLAKCEEEKIILGYKALIDWDRVREDMVTAFIAVKLSPQRGYGFDRIAERIYQYDEVESLYLMSGDFDLGVFMSGHSVKEVSTFVFGRLAPIEGVTSTSTHIILKKYKEKHCVFNAEPEQEERPLYI